MPFTAAPRNFSRIRTGATCFSFYEYFHGDNGAGLGASHQTGWTGLVANLIDEWRQETQKRLASPASAMEAVREAL